MCWAVASLSVLLVHPQAEAKSSQRPNALNVAPLTTQFAFAVQGLNNHADKARAIQTYMERVGLDAPDFGHIVQAIAEEAGEDSERPWPKSIGLPPSGIMAVYGVLHGDRPRELIALDISSKRAFVAFMVRQEEQGQWVEEGKKPARARVKRRRLPNGVEEVTVALPGATGETIRFKGNVAVLGAPPEVLDLVAWTGTPVPAVFEQLSGDSERLTAAFWSRPGELVGPSNPAMAILESVSGTTAFDAGGVRLQGTATLSQDATPFMPIARPGATGAAARRAMMNLAANVPLWFRLSLSTADALNLARTMGGKNFQRDVEGMKKELGLDPIADVAELFTGDLLFACQDGLADCVIAMGVANAERAEKTVQAMFKAFERESPETHFETQRTALKHGPEGAMRATTTVFEQAVTKRGKIDRKAERTDHARFSWGIRPHLLVIGLSPVGVERALRREASPKTVWPQRLVGPDGTILGFDDTTTLASYQRLGEPSTMMRQLLPMARHALPGTEWPGILARVADMFAGFQDRMVDGSALIRSEGLTWRMDATVATLPTAGQEGYDSALEARYEAALRHRYEGLIRTSNEALLALSNDAPDTVWGRKSRLLALGGDGSPFAVMSTLGAIGAAAGGFFGLVRKTEDSFDDGAMMGPCHFLEEQTCSPGPEHRPASCDIALARDADACSVESLRLMNP